MAKQETSRTLLYYDVNRKKMYTFHGTKLTFNYSPENGRTKVSAALPQGDKVASLKEFPQVSQEIISNDGRIQAWARRYEGEWDLELRKERHSFIVEFPEEYQSEIEDSLRKERIFYEYL